MKSKKISLFPFNDFCTYSEKIVTGKAAKIITETTTAERPFYWACGKCHSTGLYRDDDVNIGMPAIACRICGNRYYGEALAGRYRKGIAPVKVYSTETPAPAWPEHFTRELPANIVTGPNKSWDRTKEKRDDSMGKPRRRSCANCERVLSIVAYGYCFVCYYAGKGLDGAEKTAALAAIKAKIEKGEVYKGCRYDGDRHPPSRKLAQIPPLVPAGGDRSSPSPESIAKLQTQVEALGEKLALARVPAGVPVITLDFITDRDRKIYADLLDLACRLRREPEQQILWMLQNEIERDAGLLAEAPGKAVRGWPSP